MIKARKLVVGLAALLYILLLVAGVNISGGTYTLLMGTILVNQGLDEWDRYLETKNKAHLLMPILSIALMIFAIFQLVRGY